ncbi:unnamed protein product, partial [Ixodes pacificus]
GGVLQQSACGQLLEQGRLELPNDLPLPSTKLPAPSVFVEDEAFQLRPDFSRPYPGHGLDGDKRIVNYCLRRGTLRFYGAGTFQVVTGDLVNMSQPTVCRVIERVSRVLADPLFPRLVDFPEALLSSVVPLIGANLNDSDRNKIQAISNSHVPLFATDEQDFDLYMGTEDSIDPVPGATPYSHQPYGYSYEKAVPAF